MEIYKLRRLLLLFLCLLIGACTTTKTRFPEFAEQMRGEETIDVVIDAIVISDIAGPDLGFNQPRNTELLNVFRLAVEEALTERGFSPGHMELINGLNYDKLPDTNYFYSEDWKSTGIEFQGQLGMASDSPWLTPDLKSFFIAVVDEARESNYGKKETDDDAAGATIESESNDGKTFDDWEASPGVIAGLDSDFLLYVRVSGKIEPLGKSVGKGLLTGVATGVLTGGALVMIAPGSIFDVDIVVLHVSEKKILWHKRYRAEQSKPTGWRIKSAFQDFPTTTGEYVLGKERALQQKLRNKN